MSTEKKKKFIIDVTYLALILVLSYLLLQYALPLLLPFVLAFLIAYVLRRPIRFLSRVLHAPKGLVAVLLVVLTYGTIGLLLALAGIRITATITSVVQQIPSLYSAYILPELTDFFAWLEELLAKLDPSLMSALQELQSQLLNMLWQLVSSLSVVLVGGVSMATSFATSLPGFLIRLLLMVISTFFIAVDYQKIVRFCLGCLQGSTRNLVLQVKAYVVGTLFVCIRSYALIMSITFVELSVGLTLIGVNRAILVALLIAIFDILPVLGTGGIMIPWVILSALGGDLPHAFALLVLYVIITVIRNIIEPRIVGAQIGLHPVLTLMSMFVGNHLFGIVGLFGLPILLSLLRYLNENGVIRLFRMGPACLLSGSETARRAITSQRSAPMRLETIKIGRIVNAHGIRGEVRVQPDGQDPAFLTQFQTFYLDGAPVTPTANHVHKSLVLMKFPGVDDMNAALALKGKNLYIRRADAKLPEGACFDAELLGMTVCDAATGETLGEITRVDSYPAHKVYTVRGAREYLIPAVPDVFIKSVDLDANRMEVQVWEGMATDEN